MRMSEMGAAVPMVVALNVGVPAIALSRSETVPELVVLVFVLLFVLVFVTVTPDAVLVADVLVETAHAVPAQPYVHDWYTCVVHELVW